jgi:hypothetical protein
MRWMRSCQAALTLFTGNPQGQVFVFDAQTGRCLSQLEPYRVAGSTVRGCGVSEDGRCGFADL